MKAWSVCDYNAEVGIIVFAETRGQARSEARGLDGFESSDWGDIVVRRLPALDGKRDVRCALDWGKESRLYYEAGFFQDNQTPCDWCGLYEYREFPESHLTEYGDGDDAAIVCAACLEHEEKREEANTDSDAGHKGP